MGCCAGPCAYGFTAFITFAASVLSLLFYLISFWDFKGKWQQGVFKSCETELMVCVWKISNDCESMLNKQMYESSKRQTHKPVCLLLQGSRYLNTPTIAPYRRRSYHWLTGESRPLVGSLCWRIRLYWHATRWLLLTSRAQCMALSGQLWARWYSCLLSSQTAV